MGSVSPAEAAKGGILGSNPGSGRNGVPVVLRFVSVSGLFSR